MWGTDVEKEAPIESVSRSDEWIVIAFVAVKLAALAAILMLL